MKSAGARLVIATAAVLVAGPSWSQQVQLRAARAGPDLSPQSMCSPGTESTSVNRPMLTITCRWSGAPGARAAGSSSPPVPTAKIVGTCKEKNGSPVDCYWKCIKDAKSDCGGFITSCADKGGEVIGNTTEATCTGVGKQSSAERPPGIAAGGPGGASGRGLAPEVWCRPGTVRQTRANGKHRVTCTERHAPGRVGDSEKPQVPAAELEGHCDLVNGKVICDLWFCKADEDSNCSAFIKNCAGKGGTVDGTKEDATCMLP